MKVLILSCNNGGGHNAAAQALREALERRGDVCRVVDALSFLPAGWSKLISDTHSFVYRNCPELFRSGYHRAEEHRERFADHHSVSNLMALGALKLSRFLRGGGYDAAICTHVFAGLLLHHTCQKYGFNLSTAIVETDYTVTPGAEAGCLDRHFVPDASCGQDLEALGVPGEQITVTGIPVRRQFERRVSTAAALRSFGLPEGTGHIVLACGSMGCGPMQGIIDRVSRQMKEDEVLTVVCGCNVRRREQLAQRYGGLSNVRVAGRVENMSLLLDSAAVYMTKPGGISTTEAAVKGVPMVLINTVGGCEQHNLDYFVRGGGALSAEGEDALARCALNILRDGALRRTMSDALRTLVPADSAAQIAETVAEEVNKRACVCTKGA